MAGGGGGQGNKGKEGNSKEIKRTDVRMKENKIIVVRRKKCVLHGSSKDALGRISTRRIPVSQMTYFASECFLFNFHLKRMKFGLFVKLHVSNKKLIITKSHEN